SQLSATDKAALLPSLRTKREQFQDAANEALGVYFELTVDPPGQPSGPSYFPRLEQTISLAAPGQAFTVTARLYNRGKTSIDPIDIGFLTFVERAEVENLKAKTDQAPLNPGEMRATQFRIPLPRDAKYTKPSFSRRDPETETVYNISDPTLTTYPWPPYPV